MCRYLSQALSYSTLWEGSLLPKSKVITEAVDSVVPLEQTLRRLEVLAHDVGNDELERWAECELAAIQMVKSQVTEFLKVLTSVIRGLIMALLR